MKGSPVKMPAGGERVFAERDGRGNRHGWEPHFEAGRRSRAPDEARL